MKKTISLSLLLLSSTLTQADIIGAKAGVDYWHTKDHGKAGSAYVQIEHPVPLVPNVALRAITVEGEGEADSLNNVDAYGYYEILDNDLVSMDLGAGLHNISGSRHYNETLPMAVADAEWFPGSQISYYSKLNYAKNADATVTDISAGARFQLLSAIYLQAGYRHYEMETDNAGGHSDTIKGLTAGLHIDM
ncbi:TIGR04219 family outer membrane beta-barrel protein [Endozoicomonas sp. SCSIO W0465]|uniref:TIGR04219 family outer membrane beta-barrel protein n=1 Tax=Endozoicomonas sp. SCSIO W0465 TaxID=2918516 RepID=UPI002074FC18|nr:TIGR04219 family outer membrane beta-barrel protein [Endozoicomonas sp. SCSIO W0465]USE37216.1 TIGR04219 family outer membrane beta-barrel protein [Endozoicomonas sp. SCSIO W0465]